MNGPGLTGTAGVAYGASPTPPELVVTLRGRVAVTLLALVLLYVVAVWGFVAARVLPTFVLILPIHVAAVRRGLRTRVTGLELTDRHLVVSTLSRTVRLPLGDVCTNFPGGHRLRVWRRGHRESFRVYDTPRVRALLGLLPR